MEEMTRPALIKRLDKIFQKWARYSRANEGGLVECVTCGTWGDPKWCDAGHYIPRSKMATRWYWANVWPQCKGCNKWGTPAKKAWGDPEAARAGAPLQYEKALAKKGIDVDHLRRLSHQEVRYTKDDLIEMILNYEDEVELVMKKLAGTGI